MRFTVRGIMVLILFIGLASALVIQSMRVARRDGELTRIARLLADHQRSADRMEWAARMYEKGYLSKAQLEAERLNLKNLKKALFELGPHH
jgi:hypothetical protein